MNTEQIAAEIYHQRMADWPRQIRFREQLALDARSILGVALHYMFRYEMELSWRRAGLEVLALYGDFMRSELGSASTEMVRLQCDSLPCGHDHLTQRGEYANAPTP